MAKNNGKESHMKTPKELENFIKREIDSKVKQKSTKYGKLLRRREKGGEWYYGIGISDRDIFDTGRNWRTFNSAEKEVELIKANFH